MVFDFDCNCSVAGMLRKMQLVMAITAGFSNQNGAESKFIENLLKAIQ